VPHGTPGALGVLRPRDDDPVIAAIEGCVQENPRHGFDKLYPVLRTQGFGKCGLYRAYKALKLNLKRKGRRRLPARVKRGRWSSRSVPMSVGPGTSCPMHCGLVGASALSAVWQFG
jgi:hypothetical protein